MKTIFCVDDAEILADIIASRLATEGYIAHPFRDADLAFEMMLKEIPDLVVMDRSIDTQYGDDGIALCKKIRELPDGKRIKLIILSGLISNEDRERCEEIGVDEIVIKPYNTKKFVEMVNRLLQQ